MVDQAKGRVKQAVGTVTSDDDLKAEGEVDETFDKVESASVAWVVRPTCDRERQQTVKR